MGRNDGFLALIQTMLLVKFEELEKSKDSLYGSKKAFATFLTIHFPKYIKLTLHFTRTKFTNEFEGKRERKKQFPRHFNLNRTRDGNNQRGVKKKKKKKC